MSRRCVVSAGALAGGLALAAGAIGGGSLSQPAGGEWALDVDQARGMQAWQQSMQPSRYHEFLGRFVGDWDVRFEMFMQAGAEPMRVEGDSRIYWQLPGRWLAEEIESSFMGQAMNSFSLTGYDNVKRQFVGTVVDSMSTEMKSFKGGLSPDGKVLTMYGEMDEPITGEHAKMVKYQTKITDDNRFVLEVSEILYGEPWVVVRVSYTRKEADG